MKAGYEYVNKDLRAKVLERDRLRCRNCLAGGGEIHHIIFRSHGGKDVEDNLVTLCKDCHAMAHGLRTGRLPAWVLQAMILYNKWRACCGLWKDFERKSNCITCDNRSAGYMCLLNDVDVGPEDGCDQWTLRSFQVHL